MQTVCITRPLPCYTSSGADGYGRLRTPNRGSPLVLNGARRPFVTVTALFGGNKPTASGKGCFKCKGKGAIECKGCQAMLNFFKSNLLRIGNLRHDSGFGILIHRAQGRIRRMEIYSNVGNAMIVKVLGSWVVQIVVQEVSLLSKEESAEIFNALKQAVQISIQM